MKSDLRVAEVSSNRSAETAIAADLAKLTAGEVRFSRHDRMLYATDASIYQVEPLGVVIPRVVDEIEGIVEYCRAKQLAIVPRGAGTSLAGQAVNRAIVIDMSRFCTALLHVDANALRAQIEPGLVLDHFNAALAAHGLMFGPDVATSTHANIGGMIGNNSSGAHSILYGRTVENIVGLECVLGDGRRLDLHEGAALHDDDVGALTQRVADIVTPLADVIRQRFPKTLRHVDGYNLDLMLEQIEASRPGVLDRMNLAHLVCGSEGTLGTIIKAEVALVRRPPCKGLAIVAFADVDEALRAVAAILETKPAAVELLDSLVIGLARENAGCRPTLRHLPDSARSGDAAVLYVEYFAENEAEQERRFEELSALFDAKRMRVHRSAAAMEEAWRLRKAGEPLLYGRPGRRKPLTFIEDIAVDPQRLPAFIDDLRAILAAHGTTAAFYAHASVGCLHVRPLIDLHDPADRSTMERIAEEATDLTLRHGGALSGEHGDGRLRSHLLERLYGREICSAFEAIKRLFDPDGLMNPGVITAAPSMTADLRATAGELPAAGAAVDTCFHYDREEGFVGAVEMCNGAGVCRKTTGGTMCPSYRATLDERHATRGRGNALRLAISGQLSGGASGPAWNDPETLRTLDLCLSCKACKTECPSNVDIAKLKAEYLAQSYRRRGVPRQAAAFARVRAINRWGSAFHRIANVGAQLGPIDAAIRRILRIDPRRSLPGFDASLFGWFQRRRAPATEGQAVVLFGDCFTAYSEPGIGRAATAVLEALGYRVVLPHTGCCGRSAISMGALDHARRTCAGTARALEQTMQQTGASAVVACEPSCVSAIRDDWPDLRMDAADETVRAIAEHTWSIEDFVEAQWERHPTRPTGGPPASDRVLLHGHCHQKALWGVERTVDLLERTGCAVETVESGCCGMAGAFGYTRDHYDLSMAIAELALLPALRAAPDAIVTAPGTSCRHQIRDALQREALHPIELVARAMQSRQD